MKTATFPSLRVEAELREAAESVLREGETLTSLIIYVAGMVFVAMPLCMYYEVLLKVHEERVASAMS